MWEGRAREIEDQAAEIGEDAALISAAAWRARVDPRATQSLTDAALTLWASKSSLVRGGGRPLPHDREMLARCTDLQTDTSILCKRASDLWENIVQALTAAQGDARSAAAAQSAAKTGTERSAAAAQMAEAQRKIGDCEVALEILGHAGAALNRAYVYFTHVPEDLAETYEVCYDLIRRGGKLPRHGDFLTGTDPRRAA